MARKLRSIFVFIMATVLAMGFQNCGEAPDAQDQNIRNIDLGLLVEDQQELSSVSIHSFDYKAEDSTKFSIKRTGKNNFLISENGINYICDVTEENPYDDLLSTVDSLRISHPSRLKEKLDICSEFELPAQYLIVNNENDEDLYILFKNTDANGCLSYNADELIKEGKRTFITENITSEEINELVFDGQEMLDILSCTEQSDSNSISSN